MKAVNIKDIKQGKNDAPHVRRNTINIVIFRSAVNFKPFDQHLISL